MTQDIHQQAKEAYDDAKTDMHDQHIRISEDLTFSNPADPKQWDSMALDLRRGRPCLTFDRTGQFIAQVVNNGRQNKPSLKAIPVDSKGDPEVAEKLNGIFRHIEHVSRAGAAYDMLLEMQARVGLGWLRVIPQIMRPETNEQEIRIMRVHDPKSVMLQAGWVNHDGSDAMCGFAETLYSKAQFKAMWPKFAEDESWEGFGGSGWLADDSVRICEYFKVDETKSNRIVAQLHGTTDTYGEEDFHRNARPAGAKVLSTFTHKDRKVRWIKMSGKEVLEETEFPGQYIPLIPGLGDELWIDGKRYLSGLTRRLMDGQRAYNYLQSALTESLSLQPKAPFMVPLEGLEGLEADWKQLNSGSPAYLPYNAIDGSNNPIPSPTRLNPPTFPVAFANAAQIASQDMESAVGMFKANLGQQGNETSGIAIRKRQEQGDTANFHYIDNRDRAIERLGTVVMDMLPRIYDTERQARILGEDGEQDFVTIAPGMGQPSVKQGKKVVAIDLTVGAYDVRVKSGPAFASLREEQAEQLSRIMQSAPDLTPILADLWVGSQDWPESEKVQRRLAALLPPQVQQMEAEDGEDIPPEAMQQIQMKDAQIAELSHALETAHAEHMQLETEHKAKTGVETMKTQVQAQSDDKRIQAEMMKAKLAEDVRLTIAREQMASAERVAKLNAELKLLELQANAQQAAEARRDEQILEGQKMANEADNAERDRQMKQQEMQAKAEADEKKSAEDKKARDAEKAGQPDLKEHLEPIHKALKELQTNASKPRKTVINLTKSATGFTGEKVEG